MDGESEIRIEISNDPGPRAYSAEAALRSRAESHGERVAFTDPPDRFERGLGQPRSVTLAQANAIADTLCGKFRETGPVVNPCRPDPGCPAPFRQRFTNKP